MTVSTYKSENNSCGNLTVNYLGTKAKCVLFLVTNTELLFPLLQYLNHVPNFTIIFPQSHNLS
jgi:hypothetical protein